MSIKKQQKILVVGLGASGRAAARFLLGRGDLVVGVDAKASMLGADPEIRLLQQQGLQVYEEGHPLKVSDFNQLVVSPGVPPSHPLYRDARSSEVEVIGEIELACRNIKQPMLGVTGTNGKTTVTLLVTHVLNAYGISAKAVGNVGVPLISMVDCDVAADEVLVVELSSWQLETMQSKVLNAAVVLNITPDHLDRHFSMEEYVHAKFRIGQCLKPHGCWFIQDLAAREFQQQLDCGIKQYPSFSTYGYTDHADLRCDQNGVLFHETLEYYLPLRYRGFISHDAENEMAAYCLCRGFGVTAAQFCEAAATFQKPPHRNELVRICRGVSYYNDSKGTNVDAVMKAVSSMRGTSILIAGGKDKGASYDAWLRVFEGKVRYICAIGEAAPLIQQQLDGAVSVEIFPTLQQAVIRAAQEAKSGENVLLSPGCASYDMFDDYAHRGREFIKCVQSLPE